MLHLPRVWDNIRVNVKCFSLMCPSPRPTVILSSKWSKRICTYKDYRYLRNKIIAYAFTFTGLALTNFTRFKSQPKYVLLFHSDSHLPVFLTKNCHIRANHPRINIRRLFLQQQSYCKIYLHRHLIEKTEFYC